MLTPTNTALLIIDIQGKLSEIVHNSNDLIKQTQALIQGTKILNLPTIVLEQNPSKLGATHKSLQPLLDHAPTLSKTTFNGCATPAILNAIKDTKVSNWLVCGIESHICVYQTCMGLLSNGYGVNVVANCVSSRQLAEKELALAKLQQQGAKLTSVEMCLYELVGDSTSSAFKPILSLIK